MSEATMARDYLEILDFSMNEQKADINNLLSMQDSYDNRINSATWPTQAEIPTAQQFRVVEESLKPALDMCFPESNGVSLIPSDRNIDFDQWQRSEWALWTMVNHRMYLRTAALRSVKDCFKCSVGYGIVEPFTITPQAPTEILVGNRRMTMMADAEPEISIRYRYVSPGRIIPYPKGTDFNGPEATPLCFFYDPYPLWQVEQLFEGNQAVDRKYLQASLADVRKAAEDFHRSGQIRLIDFAERMGGRRDAMRNKTRPNVAPLEVPIIRVFEQPGTEVWIVPNGNREGIVLLRKDASNSTVQRRCGLVKWSAWPDGDRWFPMSMPEAHQRVGVAYDMWLNFFFDMMSRTKDARLVVNKSALPPDNRSLHPYEDIFVDGSVRDAAGYLESPRIDPSLPMVGDILDNLGKDVRGTRDFMQKNYTRGGTMAFQDLMNTMQARQQLSALILETGALKQVYEHVLTYMQQLTPEGGQELVRPSYSTTERRQILERQTITPEDLNHSYEVLVDTSERRMLGGIDDRTRFEYWKDLSQRPDVVLSEVHRLFPLPDTVLRRVFMPPEEIERIQTENRELEMIEQLGGVGGAGAGMEAPPPEEPGLEGMMGGTEGAPMGI